MREILFKSLYLEDSFLDFEDRDIESSTSEIVDGDDFVFGFVETVSQRGGRRLVDHAQHVQTRDLTCRANINAMIAFSQRYFMNYCKMATPGTRSKHYSKIKLTCVFGSLSLRIVEVSRNCDHGVVDCGSQIALGCLFHFHEDEGANLYVIEDTQYEFS